MNETDRETIDRMLDYIAHLQITRYGAFARGMASGLQIPQNDHLHEGDWMDGFVNALEWVSRELDGGEGVGMPRKNQRNASRWHWNQRRSVRELKALRIPHKPPRDTFIGSQEEE